MEKLKLHINEIDTITSILLKLSSRLAKIENDILMISSESSESTKVIEKTIFLIDFLIDFRLDKFNRTTWSSETKTRRSQSVERRNWSTKSSRDDDSSKIFHRWTIWWIWTFYSNEIDAFDGHQRYWRTFGFDWTTNSFVKSNFIEFFIICTKWKSIFIIDRRFSKFKLFDIGDEFV